MTNPTWLTAWVKVNSKHVLYPDSQLDRSLGKERKVDPTVHDRTASVSAGTESSPLPNKHHHHNHHHHHRSHSKGCDVSKASSSKDDDLSTSQKSSSNIRKIIRWKSISRSVRSSSSDCGGDLDKSIRGNSSYVAAALSGAAVLSIDQSETTVTTSAPLRSCSFGTAETGDVSQETKKKQQLVSTTNALTAEHAFRPRHAAVVKSPAEYYAKARSISMPEDLSKPLSPSPLASGTHLSASVPDLLAIAQAAEESARNHPRPIAALFHRVQHPQDPRYFDHHHHNQHQVTHPVDGIPRSVTVPPVRSFGPSQKKLHTYRSAEPSSLLHLSAGLAVPTPRSISSSEGGAAIQSSTGAAIKTQPLLQNGSGPLVNYLVPDQKTCEKCLLHEETLQSTLDDLEYLRDVALRQEQALASLKLQEDNDDVDAAPNSAKNKIMMESASQLNDVTHRYRKQVEHLTKEMRLYQHDTQAKLHKFANLCKDLNEESATRNEEAISLRRELRVVKDERDGAAEEAARLRAKVTFFEQREAHYSKLEELLDECERSGLVAIDNIYVREKMIADLTSKLEMTVALLEQEKGFSLRQQQQRQTYSKPTTITVTRMAL